MNKQQRQTVIGTLLGKSYITLPKRKNCFLTIPEAEDINWLRYKALIIGGKDTIIEDKNRFIWRSKCGVEWNDIRQEFYDDKKKVTMKILDELCDEGLCTWFLDRGKIHRKTLILGTTVFGFEGNLIIHRFFNEVGMPCYIKKERETGKICFTEEGTKTFIGTIRRAIPEFMKHRLA
jgi:hypothetical protein